METWPGAEIWRNRCHLQIAESMGRNPAQHRAHEPLWKWDVTTFPCIYSAMCWAALQQHCLQILRTSTFPKICCPDELPQSSPVCTAPAQGSHHGHTEWKHSKCEAAVSLTAQRRSVINPIMGVLLQTLIMIGICWHHYLLLLSIIFLQGKKVSCLYYKGSNLRVWSLSVPTCQKVQGTF